MSFPEDINFIENTEQYKKEIKIEGQIMHLI